MKKICITIDGPTERRIDYLSGTWKTSKSETIRYCIDQVFTDKCYNGYGVVTQKKKGDEKNAMPKTINQG